MRKAKWYHFNSSIDGKPILSFLLIVEETSILRLGTWRKIASTDAIKKWLMDPEFQLKIVTPHNIKIVESVLQNRYLTRKKFLCNGDDKKNDLWIDVVPSIIIPRDRKEYNKLLSVGNYIVKINPFPILTPFEKKLLKSQNHDFPLPLVA
jgi:hypothetical protein